MFEVHSEGSSSRFQFKPSMRDESWSHDGGRFLNELRGASGAIVVDLSSVVWADPIPLLWLACTISNELHASVKESLVVELGAPRANNRFVGFAAGQGFLHLFPASVAFRWNGRRK